jgi:hypothetical protein
VHFYVESVGAEKRQSLLKADEAIRQLDKLLSKGDSVQRMCKVLDNSSFPINHRSRVYLESNSLLGLAAFHQSFKCARELVRRGAKIDLPDKGEWVPSAVVDPDPSIY